MREASVVHPLSGQNLAAWFNTPPGRYLLDWEQAQFDQAVANCFGYHALQLGLPALQALRANRISHRWLAVPEWPSSPSSLELNMALVSHAAALPFAANSLDLLILPHTLEFSADPHAVLREVERVLVPEGRVIISGFNPLSPWGWRQWRARVASRFGCQGGMAQPFVPEVGDFLPAWRVRDWLKLLSLEVEFHARGCWCPAVHSAVWLQRWDWLDHWGPKVWPLGGAVYFLVAVKRVRSMRLLGPAWKPMRMMLRPSPVLQKNSPHKTK